jgi:hypothetical protein
LEKLKEIDNLEDMNKGEDNIKRVLWEEDLYAGQDSVADCSEHGVDIPDDSCLT